MKRLTLLTILLVVVGLTAGALELKPAFTLSGNALLQWGVDLDTGYTGFKLTPTADLVVTLMAADGSDTHAGKDGWYGSITLSNVEAWLDAPAGVVIPTPTVVAKIIGMGGKAVIGVYDGSFTTGIDYVTAIEADADATNADPVFDDDSDVDVAPTYGVNGTYFSYTVSDALMFGLEVVSNGDWTANASNEYAIAFDAQAKFAPLTINANVNYGLTYLVNPIGFGVKVAADTAMIDPWVAFDGVYDTAFAYDVGAGATATFMETVTTTLKVVYGAAFEDLDVSLVFAEPLAKGLVDNLEAGLSVYLLDIVGSTLEYKVTASAGYLVGIVKPYFEVTYGDPSDAAAYLAAKVGVSVDPILPLTKFNLEWVSTDLTAGVMGTIIAGVTVTY